MWNVAYELLITIHIHPKIMTHIHSNLCTHRALDQILSLLYCYVFSLWNLSEYLNLFKFLCTLLQPSSETLHAQPNINNYINLTVYALFLRTHLCGFENILRAKEPFNINACGKPRILMHSFCSMIHSFLLFHDPFIPSVPYIMQDIQPFTYRMIEYCILSTYSQVPLAHFNICLSP